jgi:peptidylprolyl isomerase
MKTRFLFATAILAALGVFVALRAEPQKKDDPDEAKATKTQSGLKYYDSKVGDGKAAKAGNIVEVHYTGWLQKDGKKFDSSLDRKEPFSFVLGGGEVIKGWDEGVAGMKEGGKRKLYIPAKLAYGKKGAGKDIPPDSDLLFEVELLKVKPGVEIVDLKVGDGEAAYKKAIVEVHYTGTLEKTGKKFDSSLDRKEPFTFKLGGGDVIKGWDVGVLGMKVGGKRKLIIQPELGYGAEGTRDGTIPPNAVLVFEIELLGLK